MQNYESATSDSIDCFIKSVGEGKKIRVGRESEWGAMESESQAPETLQED